MAGLAVLTLLAAYPLLGLFIVATVWRKSSWRAGALVLVLVITLPVADAVIGRQLFEHYCSTEGKLVIVETVKDVDGIGVEYGVFKDSPAYYGYRFVEGGYTYDLKQSPWMYQRAEPSATGDTVVLKNIVPRPRYVLREGPLQQSFYFNRSHVSVNEIKTGKELAGFTRIGFRGGWAEQVIFGFASSGPQNRLNCPAGHGELRAKTQQMLHTALVPASNFPPQSDARQEAGARR